MKILRAIIASLVLYATGLHAGDESSIDFSSVSQALEKLKQNSSANISHHGGWVIISLIENGNHIIWFFAPEKNAAHPAMIKRTFLEKNGKIEIVTITFCESTKQKCDAIIKQFNNLNKKIE